METVKRSEVARGLEGGRDEQIAHRGLGATALLCLIL